MKKLLFLFAILLILVSCDVNEDKEAGDVTITIDPYVIGYGWGDYFDITGAPESADKVDKVGIYIDNDLFIEDALEPYCVDDYDIRNWDYAIHEIKAKAVYSDGSNTVATISVNYSPCPIYESDVTEISGITETDAENDLIVDGNIDSDDWHFGEQYLGEITFGTAFPNPCSEAVTINYTITEGLPKVSMIVLNTNHDIIEVLIDNVNLSSGDKTETWVVPANVNDIYRVIFHASDGSHYHGDIIVE